MPAIH